uniref:Secreted protein n=1 Tax=Pyxicephalus adspersus TaxID=30357 RepID=A0AAV2ZL72_PYXAD|nr:TPA: hypothetical protein GDO54_016910 [Pyxicephalus adspersus]
MFLQDPLTVVNVFILLVIPDCNFINSVGIEFYMDHSAGENLKMGRDFCSLQHLEFVFRFMSVLHEHTWEVRTALSPIACTESYLPGRSCLIV